MNGIKFVPSTGSSQSTGSSVTWNSNPTYQSPDSAGISWYDQATHWEPNDEGIESTGSNYNQFNEPYWSTRSESNGYSWNNSAEVEWNRTSNQTSFIGANTSEAANEAPTNDMEGYTQELHGEITSNEELMEGEEAGESAVKGAEGMGGPWGIAAIAMQSLGDATTNALTAGAKETQSQDFVNNSIQQGMGAQLQAGLINEQETANIGRVGAVSKGLDLLGPVGAALGYSAGQAAFAPGNPYLNTVNSFNGMTNPQDTGIVQSLNTDAASGQTQMVENV